ncbi:hypothetical protein AB3X55_13345, partial [Alphaproteobacteria bacterium LSUCC0719]
LTKAGFLELACPPASPEAKALVNDIINIIEQSEQRQRARTAEHNAAFRSAVGLIVGDLLIAMEEREHGWSYHGLSPAAFDDQPVGYKTFKPIVETMEAVGLIVISKGRNSKAPQFDEGAAPSYHPSLATRFRPTQAMVSMAEEAGVCHGSARKHFPQQLPDNVIEVRGTSTSVRGVKTKGKKLKFAHTEKSKAMEADVKSLNKFLAGFELEGGSFSGYRRLFSNGDIAGFGFQWGGRLYGAGNDSYQTIKKTERQKMTISGEEVVEIDINASYLTILHGMAGYPLPNRDDLYTIAGYNRVIVKAWITATIGHHGFHTRWPKNAIQEIKDAGVDKPAGLTMTSLQPVILDHFPMLADWPSQKVTWADLMFTESEIIIGTMLELMHSYGMPCFSVHDSIIVRKSDQQIAMETLKDQFFRRTSIEPRLKVN